jgi:hypothetical protein
MESRGVHFGGMQPQQFLSRTVIACVEAARARSTKVKKRMSGRRKVSPVKGEGDNAAACIEFYAMLEAKQAPIIMSRV